MGVIVVMVVIVGSQGLLRVMVGGKAMRLLEVE